MSSKQKKESLKELKDKSKINFNFNLFSSKIA